MSVTEEFGLDLDTVARGIGNLPSLPAVVVELLQSLDDADADTDLLARKISRDQALVAKMLRVANSSFYGLQGKVGSIQDAIVVLGLRGVRTLASAAAVAGVFGKTSASGYDFRVFWRHSIGVALCARALAPRMRANAENAFAAGLLHDIGRLVLASCFPAHFKAALDYRQRLDCPLLDAERALLGIDHAQVGRVLTERWKFPSLMSQAIAGHHAPDGQETRSLACVLHVADAMVHALDLAGDEDEMAPRLQAPCWHSAGFSWRDSQEIFAEVEAQFESACEILAN